MMNISPRRERTSERVIRKSDGTTYIEETKTITTRRSDGTKVTKRKVTRSRSPLPVKRTGRLEDGSIQLDDASSRGMDDSRRGQHRRVKSLTGTDGSSTPSNALDRMKASMNVTVKKHKDDSSFEAAVINCIPSEFTLFASQDEVTQAQEDYFAMDNYKLPSIPGTKKNTAGSVATAALLEMMYENPKQFVAPTSGPFTAQQVLQRVQKRITIASKINNAKPTISSSRPLGPPRMDTGKYAPFALVSPKATGTRKALLIGVVSGGLGGHGNLRGPPNDIAHMRNFLTQHAGFKPENITVLLEDPTAPANAKTQPTHANIMAGFAKLVRTTRPRDAVVIQYSGHGGRTTHNLHMVPSDFSKAGGIRDEDIMRNLIKAMPAKVYTTMVVDCCYSGTLGDLPYVLKSGASKQEIEMFFDTDTRQEMVQQEKMGGEDYQKWKRSRANERFLARLSPMHMMEEAAAAASQAASAAAEITKRTSVAATQLAGDMSKRTSVAASQFADVSKRTSTAASQLAGGFSVRISDASKAMNASMSAMNSSMSAMTMNASGSVMSVRLGKDGETKRTSLSPPRYNAYDDLKTKRSSDHNRYNPYDEISGRSSHSAASTATTASTSTVGSALSTLSEAASAVTRGVGRSVSGDGSVLPKILRSKSSDGTTNDMPTRRAGKRPTDSGSPKAASSPKATKPIFARSKSSDDGENPSSPKPGRTPMFRSKSSDGTANAEGMPTRRAGRKPLAKSTTGDGSSSPKPVVRTKSGDGMFSNISPLRGGKKPNRSVTDDDGLKSPKRSKSPPRRCCVSGDGSRVPGLSPFRSRGPEEDAQDFAAAAEEAARQEAVERSRREAAAARAAARLSK